MTNNLKQSPNKDDKGKEHKENTESQERKNSEQRNSLKNDERLSVNKKGFIEIDGEVIELLPSASFRVVLENGHEILAHLSGKMRMYRILLLPGDKVKIEMSPYDMGKGRVVYRY